MSSDIQTLSNHVLMKMLGGRPEKMPDVMLAFTKAYLLSSSRDNAYGQLEMHGQVQVFS